MKALPLDGLKILLVRPAEQAKEWQIPLVQQGAEVFICPTLAIQPILPSETLSIQQIPASLNINDIIIFTSPNAVQHGLSFLPTSLPHLSIIAIGPGTANKLRKANIKATDIPSEHTSEGLLALPALQQITNKRIFIISGEGGREKMLSHLKTRGANVTKIAVYRRIKQTENLHHIHAAWQQTGLNLIIATTLEGLQNLKEATAPAIWQQLVKLPLLVLSQRLAEGAKKLGFQGQTLITNSSIDDVISKLTAWYTKLDSHS